VTDNPYADPRTAARAYDQQIREMQADLIVLCAVRDEARRLAELTTARDSARMALDGALAEAGAAAKALDRGVKAEATARARTIEAIEAVTRAGEAHERAKRTGTLRQQTAARELAGDLAKTLEEREQEQHRAKLRRDQAADAAAKADAARDVRGRSWTRLRLRWAAPDGILSVTRRLRSSAGGTRRTASRTGFRSWRRRSSRTGTAS
jgi:hypothetical protein